jgi:hypothetical protein
MYLTIESVKTKRGLSLKKRCWFNSNWNTIGYWIITRVVELRVRSSLYGWKAKT